MPPKNRLKKYQKDSYYHIYNRGNNKELIFFEDSDYVVFRNIFRSVFRELYPKIVLDTYCLLPNHFHFLVYQGSSREIEKLMRKAVTSYVLFINRKYGRVGRLFQDIYKAALVPEDKLSKIRQYILDNPKNADYEVWEHVGSGHEL